MKDQQNEQTLEYINMKRNESKQPAINEIEIAEILKEQFMKDQYIAMKIDEAKKAAEAELNVE